MKRRECLAAIHTDLTDCAVVTIMGAVAAELHSLGHRPNFFYLQHAMGLAPSIGLGIALSQPQRKVVVLDGDGSLLMNLGGLTTLGRQAPGNLTHIVFDNASFVSIGGHPTPTSRGVDLAAVAVATGIPRARALPTLDEFATAARAAIEAHVLMVLEIGDYTCANIRIFGQVPDDIRSRHLEDQRAYGHVWQSLLEDARAAGELRPELDLSVIRMLILGALNWTAEWYRPGPQSATEVAREATAMICEGIRR